MAMTMATTAIAAPITTHSAQSNANIAPILATDEHIDWAVAIATGKLVLLYLSLPA